MSNKVLSQSATNLTISNNGEWTDEMFYSIAQKCAEVNVSGLVRERKMLNFNKLMSQVCARYRDTFAAIYAKGERVPAAIFDKISVAVERVILENMTHVTAQNIISVKRSAAHVASDKKFVERVTMTGENAMTLKEQHLFVNIAIRETNDKLTKLQAKPTPDHEREQLVIKQLDKLQATKLHIEKVQAESITA